MANVFVDEQVMTDIGNAIRSKTGKSDLILPADMATEIGSIQQTVEGEGVVVGGTISITENGTHDVSAFASANVNVPVGVFPEGTVEIVENGTYDVTAKASVNVQVPTESSGTGDLESLADKQISTNASVAYINLASITPFFSVSGTSTMEGSVAVGDTIKMTINKDAFGDATQDKVDEGVYFTSANGLKLPGTRVASSGGSGGLVMKTGTVTDSTTIETGLSSVDTFILYKKGYVETGLMQLQYNKDLGTVCTYCNSYQTYAKGVNMNTATAPTISGGSVTWNPTSLTNAGMSAGIAYTWIAYGTE